MTDEQVLADLKELKQMEDFKQTTGLSFPAILALLKSTFGGDSINTLPSKRTPLQLESAAYAAEAAQHRLIL